MAVRKNGMHSELVRERIRVSALVNRLTSHCLGKLKKPMDASQVTAALGLLRKAIPDLQAIEHGGEIEHKHHVVQAEPLSEEQWAQIYGAGAESQPTH